MRLLIVGDPHARVEDLEDCQNLMKLICKTAMKEGVDSILFLGDQNHNHGIVHVEVQKFWLDSIRLLKDKGQNVIMMVGNHDLAGNGDPMCHSLLPFKMHGVRVIEKPEYLDPDILVLPYYESAEEFLAVCKENFPKTKTVICHQTFNGSKYENGFYAKDGIDPEQVPQSMIISGHIHAGQTFGKVFYPGAPRWLNRSDADVAERYIWVIDFDDLGGVKSKKQVPTSPVCRVIKHLVDTETQPIDWDSLNLEKDKVLVDIIGTTEYVEARKSELAGRGVSLRVFPNDLAAAAVKESEGIDVAFSKYFKNYKAKHGTSTDDLASIVKEKLNVLVQ